MKKYLYIVLLIGIWSCEDNKEDNKDNSSNACSEIVSNTTEALSLWSDASDYYWNNDEYPEGAKEACDAYFDAIILLKESNCLTGTGLDGWENFSLSEIEVQRTSQCDI